MKRGMRKVKEEGKESSRNNKEGRLDKEGKLKGCEKVEWKGKGKREENGEWREGD